MLTVNARQSATDPAAVAKELMAGVGLGGREFAIAFFIGCAMMPRAIQCTSIEVSAYLWGTAMKKGPDLILILIMVFVAGFLVTTVSQSDLQLAALVSDVINS